MAYSSASSAAQSLQELLQSTSQSKLIDGKRAVNNGCSGTVGQASSSNQACESKPCQKSGTSDLISLLQCSNPRSVSYATQKQASKCNKQLVQQPPFGSNQPVPFQPVVYVRPMGRAVSMANTAPSPFESVPFSPSSHSSVSFINPSLIRGLSPQRNLRHFRYPAYVQMHGPKIESSPVHLSVSKSSDNDKNSKFSTMLSSINASISSVKRNLEAALGSQRDVQENFSLNEKVRMGWSPSKRKRSNEKDLMPGSILVISSDEEDDENGKREPKTNSNARIGILQPEKNVIISDTALNIALRLPVGSENQQMVVKKPISQLEGNPVLDNLNHGLSILDEPHKILATLEDVLRERPKRLRVNLRSLYSYSKLGCLNKVLSILLENVSPAATIHSEDGKSALHAAASRGHLDILVILVYKAAGNIDVMDKFKRTPLFVAVEKGHLKAAQFLYKAGASLACKNFDGMGLVHVAAHKGHVQILNWLLCFQQNLNEQDNGGWTSLMWAAEDGNSEALKLLLKKGARTEMRDKELNTVLHWASMAGALEGCEALLNANCDLNNVNMYGDTPLHISAREGNSDVVKLFLLRGADTSIKNKEGKMPMDVCVNNPKIRDAIRLRHAIGHVTLKRQYHCDISKGKERIPVSCINEVDDEPLPLNFTYITEPIESSTVSIMKDLMSVKGCKCQNDCALEICDCVIKNEESKCWFEEGILDVKFLDLDQPVLFECSKLCRCWSHCSNRVVQKGSQFRLEVFKTTSIGWGLRTICPIPKGSFVLSYVGEVISDDEADRRADDSYLFDLDMKNSNEEDNCLDANHYGNCGRFINHSCESNLMPVRVFTHHRDWRFPGIAFFAYRDIDAYESLSFDYGDKFWEIKKKSGLRCLCNSDGCKYMG